MGSLAVRQERDGNEKTIRRESKHLCSLESRISNGEINRPFTLLLSNQVAVYLEWG